MSAIWELANWTRQFGIRQTGNRQFGMLPYKNLSQINHTLQWYREATYKNTTQHIHDK